VTLSAAGEITDILQLHERRQMEALDAEHIWEKSLIDMRFNYRPDNPLYLLLVRTCRLREPIVIDNTLAYAGCKSWVPLERPLPAGGAVPVMDDPAYERRREAIIRRIG
jgi:hypothetical protein